MKLYALMTLIYFSLLTHSLLGQSNGTIIPEEARRHFVMGTTLFKDAKTQSDFSTAVNEFKQATDLAPQWPDPLYNLALAKEATGDFAGAISDLKSYRKFIHTDVELRSVQDKIYALEAKAKKVISKQEEELKPTL